MNTAFLSDEDLLQVQSIMAQHGVPAFDASIRLWGRGKSIDVNGTLGKRELSCLLAIAGYLDTRENRDQAIEAVADASSAREHLPYAPLATSASAPA